MEVLSDICSGTRSTAEGIDVATTFGLPLISHLRSIEAAWGTSEGRGGWGERRVGQRAKHAQRRRKGAENHTTSAQRKGTHLGARKTCKET